jgi:carboxynorspermidine decarboxylase
MRPAFKEAEMRQIIPIAHHLSFNSLAQFRKFKPMLDAAKAAGHAPSPGIRVNPEHSEVEVSLYDPCSPGCSLGIRAEALEGEDLSGVEGLHFHALCEQDSDVLERTVAAVEKRFPRLLEQVQWVNMGGGHHITRKDYDVERLIRVLRTFREKWGKEVYIEPGEAAGLNTGYLIAEVQDIVGARKTASCHFQTQTTFSMSKPQPILSPIARQAMQEALRENSIAASKMTREEMIAQMRRNGSVPRPNRFLRGRKPTAA